MEIDVRVLARTEDTGSKLQRGVRDRNVTFIFWSARNKSNGAKVKGRSKKNCSIALSRDGSCPIETVSALLFAAPSLFRNNEARGGENGRESERTGMENGLARNIGNYFFPSSRRLKRIITRTKRTTFDDCRTRRERGDRESNPMMENRSERPGSRRVDTQ